MAKGAHCFEEVNERLYWFYAFYCWSSFHGTVAAVMAAHHRVWGFEKSDKISENPVFSRLLTFAPIITEESMRRTIPVAFISRSPLSIGCACSLCRFWENMRRRADARRHPFFTSHAYFFFEQEQFENAAKLRPRHCRCGTEQRNSGKRDQPKNEIV